MRRITVGAYEKALVFRNGKLVKVLSAGKHWLGINLVVQKYDITKPFFSDKELDLLMEDDEFRASVDVIQIKDNEIALQYKNGNFQMVMIPGQYCYWKDGIRYTYDLIDLDEIEIDRAINRKVLGIPAVARFLTVHSIESYEIGLLYIDGALTRELRPDVYYFWKGARNAIVKKVDLRRQQVEISGQELLTKDKAAIRLNFYADYKVVDVRNAIDENRDYARQLYVLIQLAIREYVGQLTLDELLATKSSVSTYVLDYVKDRAISLGVDVMTAGIRDIILPGEIKEIMRQVLVAEKRAQAHVITRREETASTRSLLNTAKLMESNEMLFRLKEMEYIEKISEKIGEITVNGGGQVMDQIRTLVGGK